MNLVEDQSLDDYFREQQEQVDTSKITRGSDWVDAVIDRLYGKGAETNWTPIGFSKMHGKFDFRDGEVTVWSGINKHGKTTLLSNVMLNVMTRNKKVCIASMEMKPAESMTKMTKQAAGVETPSQDFIRAFGKWTDSRLWIYNHVGRLAAARVLALAVYVRKVLGVDHLVIDSLMKCGIGVDDYNAQKDFVDALCATARDTGLHVHLVAHQKKPESEKVAPDKSGIKGTSEIGDLPDNLVIVYKNLKKIDEITAAEREKDEAKRGQRMKDAMAVPDAYVRIAGQRNHPWEGSFAFWFDKGSQQFTESSWAKPMYLDFEMGMFR